MTDTINPASPTDPQEIYRQQAELAKEREELSSMFQILTILKNATDESQEKN